jgi:hypothetical protein
MSNDEIDGLIAMLQRIMDAEAVLGAVLHGGDHIEKNRVNGRRLLALAVRYARKHGEGPTADTLEALIDMFADDYEQGCAQLRELRVDVRVRLNAATRAAGLPDVPPASVRMAMPFRRSEPKTGRNDPCRCGSGKKYKRCHGRAGLLH